uniref:protein CURVATURE THYLAKOID 1C, chloroplastic n=1 Tax=Erigeron canadensis TaxID=72917 RepID=UPI001CB97E43|nr:protein CURVATURE THYLAKOID 1C, chloroplastic [Erigeron canadensis]
MANLVSSLPFSPLFACENRPFCTPVQIHTVFSPTGGRQGRVAVIAKASSGSSESSTSLDIVQSVRSFWDTPEDRLALFGLGFASVVALWASLTVVTAIDKLPVVPSVFELIGILFTTWFTYRYLLFKPDRKELFQIINKSLADVLGK